MITVHVPSDCIPCRYNAHSECEGADLCACTHWTELPLHFSPLLPEKPDWKALAQECSQAYLDFERINTAVKRGDPDADGKAWWEAKNRLDKVVSVIDSWVHGGELYGRLLARDRILKGQ